VVLVGLLDEEGHAAVLGGDDTDGLWESIRTRVAGVGAGQKAYLVGDLALILAAVQVPQVQRVARELDTVRPLDKRSAVSLCVSSTPIRRRRRPAELTGNLPSQIVRNSSGHFVDCVNADGVRACRFFAISKSRCGISQSVDCQIALVPALEQHHAELTLERLDRGGARPMPPGMQPQDDDLDIYRKCGFVQCVFSSHTATSAVTFSSPFFLSFPSITQFILLLRSIRPPAPPNTSGDHLNALH
jgi:hypothetical protein